MKTSRDEEARAQELLAKIDRARVPRHIAIIMDGNGRWAKKAGFIERLRGHEAAAESVRASVRGCGQAGVSALTLYAFSTENWKRPAHEVAGLMRLLERFCKSEIPELNENNVRMTTSGEIDQLPAYTRRALANTIKALASNTGLVLNLALNYGGRQEITRAARALAREVRAGRLDPEAISEGDLAARLYHPELGDPDLLIRTSGELRVSNFMLWEIAYAEIVVTPTLWPDFRKSHLFEAILEYQKRDRRYGGIIGGVARNV
ncbi:MAG: isoprenyl transferase [Candidatus Sumerlaeota bacterium]|nr:isoprenyl transferase [Candidatus Sumerlaeota bacterium]